MQILRYAAFTAAPDGGNPAGVVLDATGLTDRTCCGLPRGRLLGDRVPGARHEPGAFDVRYFAPLAEVPFCGHATIASAVAFGERHGPGLLRFHTAAGEIPVEVTPDEGGLLRATLVSVPPRTVSLDPADSRKCWPRSAGPAAELDPALPPRVAYAGVWHPVLATATRARLAELDYDYERLGRLMADRDWTTVALVHREHSTLFHARNPFPPGGVREDPATGAAAAALGGYLRELGLVELPVTVTVRQGEDMGRPSDFEGHHRRRPGVRHRGVRHGRPDRLTGIRRRPAWSGWPPDRPRHSR